MSTWNVQEFVGALVAAVTLSRAPTNPAAVLGARTPVVWFQACPR